MERRKEAQIAFRLEDSLARRFKSECALRRDKVTTVLTRASEEYIARGKAERNPE